LGSENYEGIQSASRSFPSYLRKFNDKLSHQNFMKIQEYVDITVIVKVNMIEVDFPLYGFDLTAVKIHRGTLQSEISTVELRSRLHIPFSPN
jgi:hypothetical protein